jgi:RimJ/RimL family protein N-acetyltransferase
MNTGIGSGWTVEMCRNQLTGHERFRPDGFFMVTFDGQPVGSACAWPNSTDPDERVAQVHMVCVLPEHRSKGLGYLVTLAVMRYMREKGFQETFLFTDDFRIPAIRAYLRLGFGPDYLDDSHRYRWGRIFSLIGMTDIRWREVRPEPVSWQIRESGGNRALLVVMDSSQPESYDLARRAALSVLFHLDIPYRILDLAVAREPAQGMTTHQAIMLAQKGIGDSLPEFLARQIARAVQEGVGFISLDHRIDLYPEALSALAPARSVQTTHETRAVVVSTASHFILKGQDKGRVFRLRSPVELSCSVVSEADAVLMETEDQMPALVRGRHGNGRTVQFLFDPQIWDMSCLGHCEGMDGLFWRCIAWVSRKPFIMKAMPSYVTFRVGQATGQADGFAWVHSLVERGWRPHVGALTEELHDAEWKTLRALVDAGRITWFPQALTRDRSAYFHLPGRKAYTDDELSACLEQIKSKINRYGLLPDKNFDPATGSYGRNVPSTLPSEWGMMFSLSPYLPDESMQGERLNWEPAPYGHPGYALDALFGFPNIFVVASGAVSGRRIQDMGNRRYQIMDDHDPSFPEPDGSVARNRGTEKRLRETLLHALDARFSGMVYLDEREIIGMGGERWSRFLDDLDVLVSETGGIRMDQETVCAYAVSKVRSHLTHAGYERDKDILRIHLNGSSAVPLQIQIVDEQDEEHSLTVDSFDDRHEESIKLGEWIK